MGRNAPPPTPAPHCIRRGAANEILRTGPIIATIMRGGGGIQADMGSIPSYAPRWGTRSVILPNAPQGRATSPRRRTHPPPLMGFKLSFPSLTASPDDGSGPPISFVGDGPATY